MINGTKNFDYLTVDSIQWATGHVRPRMTLEDKRAKHRVHQRDFVSRQRKRLEELRRELRCHRLQLLRLQAIQEVTALSKQNESIRAQLMGDSSPLKLEPDSLLCTSNPFTAEPEGLPLEEDDNALRELLALLPMIDTTDVALVSSCWSSCSKKEDQLAPLPWPPTTPLWMPTAEMLI